MQHKQSLALDRNALEAVVARVLEQGGKAGATAAEAVVSVDNGLGVTARLGEVETLEYHRDKGLGLTLYFGQRKGNASTADLSDSGIAEAVAAAAAIARYTAEDPYAGLPDAALMASDYPELDLDHPWDISAEQAVELAQRCEAAARSHDARIVNSEGASVNTSRGTVVYGNTHGFIGGYTGTRHSVSCSVVGEQDGAMQRDYWYASSRLADALGDVEAIGRRAAERTVRRLGGRQLGTRDVPVIFESDLARSLIGHFTAAVRGASLYRKASFLLDRLGEQVFPDFLALREEPHLPRALGSAPFDGEGVATQARDIVSGGVLQGYVLDSYSARRLGMQTTGNAGGVHNLSVSHGDLDLPGLLREMGTGLLVTELIGHGINMVTGDYSRGAAGFWVENGEIQYPVEEITVAGNLKEMFRGILAVGNDVDTRGNIRTGSILLDRLTVAGQ
ncbi:metalloprotease PmbA [Acidihalobacter ferrooxydans]|uniref:Metalloprotease PmbA n=1 Tax=Acidihalobacter ferrooxydans TaxID=1765967 RepID=A0A1P8UG68_9GAMM|nr:metalloprotease PmbA [Acidihalobacter ferrooxydans]APZ42761.1 metalloprotease PmbA [Acidihalobacter ferrooxydans]